MNHHHSSEGFAPTLECYIEHLKHLGLEIDEKVWPYDTWKKI